MDGLSDKVKGKKDLEKELYRAIVLQDKIEAKTEAFKTKEKDAKQRIAELQKQIEQETQGRAIIFP